MPGWTCSLGQRKDFEASPSGTTSSSSRGFIGDGATCSESTRAGTGGVRSPASSRRDLRTDPNPLGLHPVTVRKIVGNSLRIGPIEAIDGTPVVDIKPVLPGSKR